MDTELLENMKEIKKNEYNFDIGKLMAFWRVSRVADRFVFLVQKNGSALHNASSETQGQSVSKGAVFKISNAACRPWIFSLPMDHPWVSEDAHNVGIETSTKVNGITKSIVEQ